MRFISQIFNQDRIFKNAFLCLLFLFYFPGCSFFGINNKPETNKNIEVRESYYPNGNIEFKAAYLNGKLDGLSRYWDKDGNLISEADYSNGLPHGKWIKYHPNGNPMNVVNYFHGQKHGDEYWYYETGQLKSEIKYQYGESVTEIIRWNLDGIIIY